MLGLSRHVGQSSQGNTHRKMARKCQLYASSPAAAPTHTARWVGKAGGELTKKENYKREARPFPSDLVRKLVQGVYAMRAHTRWARMRTCPEQRSSKARHCPKCHCAR